MKQGMVRISFDIPEEEHHELKRTCLDGRTSIKEFVRQSLQFSVKKAQKDALNQSLRKAVQQSKEGKARIITSEELDKMIEDG